MATTVTTRKAYVVNNGAPRDVTNIKHSIPTTETGDVIYTRGLPFTVSLSPATSGKLQYTASSPVDIDAGTATWIDWNRGTVTSACADVPEGPTSGIRGVSVSGTLTLEFLQVSG